MHAKIITTEVQNKRSITSSSAIICPQGPGPKGGGGGVPNCQSRRRRRDRLSTLTKIGHTSWAA